MNIGEATEDMSIYLDRGEIAALKRKERARYIFDHDRYRFFDLLMSTTKKKLCASRLAINALKNETVSQSSPKEIIENECPICLDEFSLKTKITYMPCNHIYHRRCLSRWLRRSNKCPYCKHEIESNNEYYELIKEIREYMIFNEIDAY